MITFCFGFPSLLPWAFAGGTEEEKPGERGRRLKAGAGTPPHTSLSRGILLLGAAGAPHSSSPGHRGPAPALPWGCAPRARTATYLNLSQDIQAFCDLPKYHMLAIQPIRLVTCQEELGAIGVWAGVGHGEQAWGREGARQLPPAWLLRPGSLRPGDVPTTRMPYLPLN